MKDAVRDKGRGENINCVMDMAKNDRGSSNQSQRDKSAAQYFIRPKSHGKEKGEAGMAGKEKLAANYKFIHHFIGINYLPVRIGTDMRHRYENRPDNDEEGNTF